MALSGSCDTPDSWSRKLYNVLRPAPHDSLCPILANSYSRHKHLPGEIWKHIFSTSIYHDLASFSIGSAAKRMISWRRFVRVDHIGLSGVVLYEIPVNLATATTHGGRISTCCAVSQRLTLQSVFGDMSDPDTQGMDLNDLLDVVGAKVIYFPAYACTSFIVGQVMSAFFRDQPGNRPFPAYYGFSICLREKDLELQVGSTEGSLAGASGHQHTITGNAKIVSIPSDEQLASRRQQLLSMSLEADSPYSSLCVRTSTLHDVDLSSQEKPDYLAPLDGAQFSPLTIMSETTFSRSTQTLYTYDGIVLSFIDFAIAMSDP